jgi:hypothetical protein
VKELVGTILLVRPLAKANETRTSVLPLFLYFIHFSLAQFTLQDEETQQTWLNVELGTVPQYKKFPSWGYVFTYHVRRGLGRPKMSKSFLQPARENVARRKNGSLQGKTKTLLSIRGNCPHRQRLQRFKLVHGSRRSVC